MGYLFKLLRLLQRVLLQGRRETRQAGELGRCLRWTTQLWNALAWGHWRLLFRLLLLLLLLLRVKSSAVGMVARLLLVGHGRLSKRMVIVLDWVGGQLVGTVAGSNILVLNIIGLFASLSCNYMRLGWLEVVLIVFHSRRGLLPLLVVILR